MINIKNINSVNFKTKGILYFRGTKKSFNSYLKTINKMFGPNETLINIKKNMIKSKTYK